MNHREQNLYVRTAMLNKMTSAAKFLLHLVRVRFV